MLVEDDRNGETDLVDIVVSESSIDYDGSITPLPIIKVDNQIWLLHQKFSDNVFIYRKNPE